MDGSSVYDPVQFPGADGILARLTPARAITVTRLEAQAERGPAKYDATSGTNIACTKGIGFKITDDKSTYTLTVPSAAMMKTGANNPPSADSGPIRLRFPGCQDNIG